MPTKRDVFHHLSREELLAIVDRFELDARWPPNEGLVDTVAASRANLRTLVRRKLMR